MSLVGTRPPTVDECIRIFILFKYPLYGVGSYISIILVGKFAKKGKNCIDN